VLADAANVLSDQLRTLLFRLAKLLKPHADGLEERFLRQLKGLRYDQRQRSALAALTPGAAARVLARGRPPAEFLEQVEYNGRRLAKLNLPPHDVVEALAAYDGLLEPMLGRLIPSEYANLRWAHEQLQFCVILTLNKAYYQVREVEAQAFYELFRAELEARNLGQLLAGCLGVLARFCRADAAQLYLLSDDATAWILKASVSSGKGRDLKVARSGVARPCQAALRKQLSRSRSMQPGRRGSAMVLDQGWWRRFASCWSVPLLSGNRATGLMQFGFSKHYEWLPREQELLEAAAERCLAAAAKARLVEDLAARERQIRCLAERMLQIEEVERRRISRELHDEAGQSLLYMRLQLELLERELPERDGAWRRRVAELRDVMQRTILEMRRLIAALSPAVLEQLGLAAAIRQLVNRVRQVCPCRIRLHLAALEGLPKQVQAIVYRLVQECCNNVAKHSRASSVNISLTSADGILRLYVEDDGVGFHVGEALARGDSFGLAGIRERVALLGGSFDIQSGSRGHRTTAGRKGRSGTRITVELPVPTDSQQIG